MILICIGRLLQCCYIKETDCRNKKAVAASKGHFINLATKNKDTKFCFSIFYFLRAFVTLPCQQAGLW